MRATNAIRVVPSPSRLSIPDMELRYRELLAAKIRRSLFRKDSARGYRLLDPLGYVTGHKRFKTD
ncbi:MAG TPA: hypothetical protein PKN85_09335, partial [Syntrophorhabdaceae bacterium]|nr:hypothetical protein [Syntrophorhabdaceae bacterium]